MPDTQEVSSKLLESKTNRCRPKGTHLTGQPVKDFRLNGYLCLRREEAIEEIRGLSWP